jgi:hypothetical protein
MDTAAIIAALEAERDRLNQAIAAIRGRGAVTGGRGRRRLSAASKKRISEGMTRSWAKRKKAA